MLKLGVHKTFKGKRLYKEVWRDVKEYEGLYAVSNLGRIRSLNYKGKKGNVRVLKPGIDTKGYYYVKLYKERVFKVARVHRLVATAFIPNPENKPCIDHINTIRTDNRTQNLRWATVKENHNNELSLKIRSKIRKGKKLSEEQKARRREMSPTKRRVICIETGIIYDSTHEAKRQTGIDNGNISASCRGKNRRAGGYHWEYI